MSPTILRERISEGRPHPLGATWDGLGVNFALFSAHAERVELCLFDARRGSGSWSASSCRNIPTRYSTATCGRTARARCTPTACTARTRRKPGTASTTTSCCSTPMPRRMSAGFDWHPACLRLHDRAPRRRGPVVRHGGTAPAFMPKCRVIDPAFTWGRDHGPAWCRGSVPSCTRRMSAGFTKLHPAVPEPLRGTFAGLAAPEVLDYIRSLGVTSVELLPVQTFVNDDHPAQASGLTELLGLQLHRLLRARPALRRTARTSRSPSSSRWWRASTTPGSR